MSDIYNGTKTGFMDGGSGTSVYTTTEMPLNLGGGDTIGVLLGTTEVSYTFDAGDADYAGDIFDGGTTAYEFGQGSQGGSNYTRQTLANETINEDNTNNRAEFDADDVTFAGLDGAEIQFALVVKQVGGDWTTLGDDPVIAYITSADFPLQTNGGDVTISWDANGIVHIT
jgi:hypothetical protein